MSFYKFVLVNFTLTIIYKFEENGNSLMGQIIVFEWQIIQSMFIRSLTDYPLLLAANRCEYYSYGRRTISAAPKI